MQIAGQAAIVTGGASGLGGATAEMLAKAGAKVTIFDKGALDCTLKARVECAVYRSNGITENLPWGGVIK